MKEQSVFPSVTNARQNSRTQVYGRALQIQMISKTQIWPVRFQDSRLLSLWLAPNSRLHAGA